MRARGPFPRNLELNIRWQTMLRLTRFDIGVVEVFVPALAAATWRSASSQVCANIRIPLHTRVLTARSDRLADSPTIDVVRRTRAGRECDNARNCRDSAGILNNSQRHYRGS
jgi:hypothetical protein